MILKQVKHKYPFEQNTRLVLPPQATLPEVVSVYEYALAFDNQAYDMESLEKRIGQLIPISTVRERLAVVFGYMFTPASVYETPEVKGSYEVWLIGKPVTAIYGMPKANMYIAAFPQTRMGGFWSVQDSPIKHYFNFVEE